MFTFFLWFLLTAASVWVFFSTTRNYLPFQRRSNSIPSVQTNLNVDLQKIKRSSTIQFSSFREPISNVDPFF